MHVSFQGHAWYPGIGTGDSLSPQPFCTRCSKPLPWNQMNTEQIRKLILGVINDKQGQNVPDTSIVEKTGFALEDIRDHLVLLRDEGMLILAKDLSRNCSARLTERGRVTLKEEPKVTGSADIAPPVEIQESLARFRTDHPNKAKSAFIIMRFGTTGIHNKVVEGIKLALQPYGIVGLRADDKQYHDDLFNNVLTYIYGCGIGIAVFERIESEDFNPNVSLEVGYLMALKRPVCLLKDKNLPLLQSDLVGKLYRAFDPQDPVKSIPLVLPHWLRDKNLDHC